jgi:hypothetical protein
VAPGTGPGGPPGRPPGARRPGLAATGGQPGPCPDGGRRQWWAHHLGRSHHHGHGPHVHHHRPAPGRTRHRRLPGQGRKRRRWWGRNHERPTLALRVRRYAPSPAGPRIPADRTVRRRRRAGGDQDGIRLHRIHRRPPGRGPAGGVVGPIDHRGRGPTPSRRPRALHLRLLRRSRQGGPRAGTGGVLLPGTSYRRPTGG